MMEGITDQEAFLHLWQKRNLETENHDLPRRVDTMGFNLGQLNFLRTAVSNINDDSVADKSCELLQQYGKLMDKTEKEGGLNNHADPILTLIGNSKNVLLQMLEQKKQK
ncbi:uncharacterized protein LOC123504511 isoform X2 [Portunus trituberculatus]|uniref:uncharacterized protein LOC123504511 isoform X2 n=1 Tax=Portunus trituberculatus TaxID=210409 RepID=UPI001E1CCA30|nr:uncharacterized protein LOC123504511 isoform X2 [Portunus trituberculatus]